MLHKSNFETMKPYRDFKYWFKFDICTDKLFVIDRESGNVVQTILDAYNKLVGDIGVKFEEDTDVRYNDFKDFFVRPEMDLYDAQPDNNSPEGLIHYYEKLLMASNMVIAEEDGKDPDSVIDSTLKCFEWLRTTDFYSCPASTQYHDNFNSGLLLHTLKVADRCKELCKSNLFANKVSYARAIRACLLHDWCKIGLYEPFNKNVKNDETGIWEQVTLYKYRRDRSVCLGHGASSVFLASRFFKISYEEALAIRWHMGEYNVVESEVTEFSQACRKYPMVYLIQFADRMSVVEY